MEKGDIIRVSIVRRADMGAEHFGIFDGDRGGIISKDIVLKVRK